QDDHDDDDATGDEQRRGAAQQLSHVPPSYLTRRESRRSARGLPPVWQAGQYWKDLLAKETSRTVSPQTGQGRPVRPCTRSPERFSPLSCAAPCPTERSTASVSTERMAVSSSSTRSAGSLPAVA